MTPVERLIEECGNDPLRLAREIGRLQEALEQRQAQLEHSQGELKRLQEDLAYKEKLLAEAEQTIAELQRQLFGPKAEKLTPEQQEQAEELARDVHQQAEREPPLSRGVLRSQEPKPPKESSSSRRRRSRCHTPVNVETHRIVLEPEELHGDPSAQGARYIGQEITVEYDFIHARLIRKEYIRPKYAKSSDSDSSAVFIAPLPPRLVPQSRLGLGLAVHIVLSRFDDHLSYYALERIFFERHGVVIPRQQMVQWVEKIALWLLSLYELLWQEMKAVGYVQIDETPVKVLDPGVKGKAGQGFLWFYSTPDGDVFLEFDSSRSHAVPLKRLEGFEGTIQADGYVAYKTLQKRSPGVRRLGCLAHARRKFYTALQESDGEAIWFISQIRQLYEIESRIHNAAPAERLQTRRVQAAPIWKAMKHRANRLKADGKFLPQSTMSKALDYFLSEYTALVGYLRRPEFQIDNNLVENDIRPSAVGRKRWLFIGHPDAGWRSAVLYTFIQSCRRRGINPQEYLTDVLSRLPDMTTSQLKDLLPGRWQPKPQPPPGVVTVSPASPP